MSLTENLLSKMFAEDWEKFGNKEGGANDGGDQSGWYRDNDGIEVLVKSDTSRKLFGGKKTNHDKNMCEVFASQFLRLINPDDPDSFADVRLVVKKGAKLTFDDNKPYWDETGENIALASVAIGNKQNGSKDLYVDAYDAYMDPSEENPLKKNWQALPPPKTRPRKRPKMAGTINQEPTRTVIRSGRYTNIPRVVAGAAIVDAPDGHFENLRAIDIPGQAYKKKVARIDLGDALNNLDGELHLHAILRYPPIIGPTNHNPEIPKDILITQELADRLNAYANFDNTQLREGVNWIVDYIARFYGRQPIASFAKRVNTKVARKDSREQIIENCKTHLGNNFTLKQRASHNLALEVQMSLCFTLDSTSKKFVLSNRDRLEQLLKGQYKNTADLDFFIDHIRPIGKFFHFRSEHQKGFLARRRLNKLLRREIGTLYPDKIKDLVTPYGQRLKNAFHKIFNSDDNDRLANSSGLLYIFKSLINFPSKGNYYNWLEWGLGGFGIIPLIKNSMKFLFEYIPAIFEELFGFLYEKSEMYLSKPHAQRDPNMAVFSRIGVAMTYPLYLSFMGLRLLTMRATSPVRSIKQAFEFGTELGLNLFPFAPILSKGVAYVFAGLSAALTIVLTSIFAIYTFPILGTVISSKIPLAIDAAANWFAKIPVIGDIITYLGSSLGGPGISSIAGSAFHAAAIGAATTIAATFTVIGLPLRSLLKWLGKEITDAWNWKPVVVIQHPEFEENEVAAESKDFNSSTKNMLGGEFSPKTNLAHQNEFKENHEQKPQPMPKIVKLLRVSNKKFGTMKLFMAGKGKNTVDTVHTDDKRNNAHVK